MSIETVTERYKEKTGKSAILFRKSISRLPGGIGGSAPSFNPYPMFIKRGEGS